MKLPTELPRDVSIWIAFHASVRAMLWCLIAGVLIALIWIVAYADPLLDRIGAR